MDRLIQLHHNLINPGKSSTFQPPLVSSVSCSCIQSDVNLNGQTSRNSCKEIARDQHGILPGLPDDLAISCLIRVSRIEHRKMLLVCKSWNQLLSENFFYSLRKSHGMSEEWLYVIKRGPDRRISLRAFDPIYKRWRHIPPVPWEYSDSSMFNSAVLIDYHLYLFGGKHQIKGPTKIVIFYCARTNKWCRAPEMLTNHHRLRVTSCVINNCLYVSSENQINNDALRFAEVYDPSKNSWNFTSKTSITIGPYISFEHSFNHNGTRFLKRFESKHNVMYEAYSSEMNAWIPVSIEKGWSSDKFCISLKGQLYALHCEEDKCKFDIYDRTTDSWKKFMDTKDLCVGAYVVALVPLNGKLCIIFNNMSIGLVDVLSTNKQEERISYIWENIDGEGSRSSVICCHVLEV